MKKHLSILISCLGVITLSSCNNFISDTTHTKIIADSNYSADYLMLNRYNVNLHVGESYQLSIMAIPEKYANEKISFRSKNSGIAEVSDKGLISAKSTGFTQIEMLNEANAVIEKVNVAVNTDLSNADVVKQCEKLYGNMTAPGFVVDNKIKAHESASEQYYIEDKITREVAYVEDLTFSIPDAYFKIESQDISVLTESGAVEHSSGQWEFFVDEYWIGYFFRTTNTTRNYYEVDCKSYLSRKAEKVDIIYDILDMFFVDGRKIIDDVMSECIGIRDVDYSDPLSETNGFIPSCFDNEFTNVPAKKGGKSGENDLFSSITLYNENQVIDAKDEDDIDIESDTIYNETQVIDNYYHDNRVEGSYVTTSMDYKVGDKKAKRTFTKEYRYDRDFKITYPDFETYKKVEQFYDL